MFERAVLTKFGLDIPSAVFFPGSVKLYNVCRASGALGESPEDIYFLVLTCKSFGPIGRSCRAFDGVDFASGVVANFEDLAKFASADRLQFVKLSVIAEATWEALAEKSTMGSAMGVIKCWT